MSSDVTGDVSRQPLGPADALRRAWLAWTIMLAIPFFVFLGVIVYLMADGAGEREQLGFWWFVVAVLWLLIGVPLSFFWQGHVFKAYWGGHTVSPGDYLRGKLVVWGALEFGGLFSLAGCIISGELLPNLLPALVAFMFFVVLWPNGRAMQRGVGDEDDPEVYREPR